MSAPFHVVRNVVGSRNLHPQPFKLEGVVPRPNTPPSVPPTVVPGAPLVSPRPVTSARPAAATGLTIHVPSRSTVPLVTPPEPTTPTNLLAGPVTPTTPTTPMTPTTPTNVLAGSTTPTTPTTPTNVLAAGPVAPLPLRPPPPPGAPAAPLPPHGPAAMATPAAPKKIEPTKSIGTHTFVVIDKEAFDLSSAAPEPILGGPKVLNRDEFLDRFSPRPGNSKEKAYSDVVIKYWRTPTILGKSKSVTPKKVVPKESATMTGGAPDVFRIPCLPDDIALLKETFTFYKQYLQIKIDELKTESDEKNFWTIQRDYVIRYLEALNQPINKDTCIDAPETIVDTGAADTSSATDYYAIIPKIFYLLYTNAKQRTPLVAKDIFDKYPMLGQNARDYMNQLLTNTAGPFEGDHGIYDMSIGVVELFYLLPKLFPDLYGHLIPDRQSVENLAKARAGLPVSEVVAVPTTKDEETQTLRDPDVKGKLAPILEKFKGLPEASKDLIILAILNALKAYADGKMDEALAEIEKAFNNLQGYIDGLVKHNTNMADAISLTVQAYNELQKKRTDALNGPAEYTGDLTKITTSLSSLRDLETDVAKKDRYQTLLTAEAALDEAIKAAKKKVIAAEKKYADAEAAAAKAATAPAATAPAATAKPVIDPNTARYRAERDAARAELAAEKAKVADLETQLAAAKAALASACDADKARVTQLEGELAQALMDLQEEKQKPGPAVDPNTARYRAERDAARAELEAEKAKGVANAARIAELEATLAAAEETLKTACDADKARIVELEAELEEERKKGGPNYSEYDTYIAELEGQLAQAQTDLELERKKAGPDCTPYQKRIDELKALLVDVRNKLAHACEADRAYIAKLEADLAAERRKASPDCSALERQLAENKRAYEATIAALQADLKRIRGERDAVKRQLADLTNTGGRVSDEARAAIAKASTTIDTIIAQRDQALASKYKLYAEISQHIQGLMRELGQHAVSLKGLGNLASAKGLQQAMSVPLNLPLDNRLAGHDQVNMKRFEDGIDKLLEYLSALDTNYKRWVEVFEQGSQTGPSEPSRRSVSSSRSSRSQNSWSEGTPDDAGDFRIRIEYNGQNEIYNVSVSRTRSEANTESGFIDKVYRAFDPAKVSASPEVDWKKQLRTYLETQKIALKTLQDAGDRLVENGYRIYYMANEGANNAYNNVMPSRGYQPFRGGANNKPIKVSPDDLTPVIAEQNAWEDVNNAYNSLDPEYQQMLPEPSDPAPISSLVEPFNKYIAENADEEPLEEARTAVGMLSPEQVENSLQNENSSEMDHITPLYEKALPHVNKAWIPTMAKADMVQQLALNNSV